MPSVNVITLKRSAVKGKVPTVSNLTSGELAINTRDGRLYSANTTHVYEIGANPHNLTVGSGGFSIANGNITFPSADGTENQILKILELANKEKNAIILYTIVDNNLAKFLANTCDQKKIPCFGVLGSLILSFSKLFNQKASHEPSGQHALNEEYYNRIEAIQFTMNHDDGN